MEAVCSSEYSVTFTRLHGVTTQNTFLFIVTFLKTSNPEYNELLTKELNIVFRNTALPTVCNTVNSQPVIVTQIRGLIKVCTSVKNDLTLKRNKREGQ
jgi:hypothetical protein